MSQRTGYIVHQQIYSSHRSTIFRATRIRDGLSVILKQPGSDYLDRRRILKMRHEYAIARRVDGEGSVRALDLEELPDRVMLVLEDFGGTSLRHLLEERRCLDVATFLDFALRISRALDHVHRCGVTHKDIKPHNIIVNSTTGEVKITDFSLSVGLSLEAVSPELPAHLMGTLAYMAPEQTGRMNRGVDYRSDYYALGATFFESLTGRCVFATDSPLELLHAHVAQMPPSPREVSPSVPAGLAAIVLKLLAKAPEERYQSIWGLVSDLEECQRQWRAGGTLGVFPLATADRSRQFRLPQGLYGRDSDISLLTRMYSSATTDRAQLVLISGSAGVGKSSLVNELRRVTVANRGRFVMGKCDQFVRGVPFNAVHQALCQLMKQTLEEGEVETAATRDRLQAVLGANTAVLAEAIPESRALLDEQSLPVSLPSPESSKRLTLVLSRTIQVFATLERPLVLFLDDLQWTDSATLALLQSLPQDTSFRHLLLVGAYRDTEVFASHPLTLALAELRAAGTSWTQLDLLPLGMAEVAQMLRETTAAHDERVMKLARIIHTRTGGNPLSVKAFLRFLHQQDLIYFGPRSLQWEWDITRIESGEVPDDVAALMATEILRLPRATQTILQLAACLGVTFGIRDLIVAHGATAGETMRALWTAIERGLVLAPSKDSLLLDPQGGAGEPMDLDVSFSFLHDRVRQAAYLLIPQERRPGIHVEVGLRLYEHARDTQTIDTRVFTILPHLSHAPEQIGPDALRLALADIHLTAGHRAKTSGVYRTACEFFRIGDALIPPASRQQEHARIFALQRGLAESSYLAGDFEVAASRFSNLLQQARTPEQRANILGLQAVLNALNSRHAESLELGLEGLRLLGINIPSTPDESSIVAERQAVDVALGGRSAAQLLELHLLEDPDAELASELLASISAPAYFFSQKLFVLLTLRLVRLSLQHGNSRHSAYGYALYGLIISNLLDDPVSGRQFSQLAVELAARFRDPIPYARSLFVHAGYIDYWTRSVRVSIPPLAEAYKLLLENGDWQHAGYCFAYLLRRRYAVGETLSELLVASQEFIDFLYTRKDSENVYSQWAFRQLMLRLAGAKDAQTPQLTHIRWPASRAYVAMVLTEGHYLFRETEQALLMSQEVAALRSTSPGAFMLTTHAFYHALSAAAVYLNDGRSRRQDLLAVMEQHCAYLAQCALRVPENFSPYHLLVCAELAHVRGHIREALIHYEDAITASRASGFTSVEAIACEQTCRLQENLGRAPLASAYLLEALNAYERWGASGKARHLAIEKAQLLQSHGKILEAWKNGDWHAIATAPPPSTGESPEPLSSAGALDASSRSESLDMSSVMKASQAISSELNLSQLATNLIDILIESAGAQRGVLALRRDGDFFIEVVGTVGTGSGSLVPACRIADGNALSQSIAKLVLSTGTPLLVDDASAQEPFREDSYIISHNVRSVLCAPIVHRQQTIGLIYLENNLTAGAFSTNRFNVLGMLSAQAAISLENAGLYRKLEESNRTLEHRVQERTEELHQKNAELQRALDRLKTMQAQIITQEKLASLGALTAGIAHELKNPLNFVKNFAELSSDLIQEIHEALSTSQNTTRQEEFESLLEHLKQNTLKVCEHTQRASSIINGMLRHARNNRGESQATSINRLVEESVELVQQGLRAKSPSHLVLMETSLDESVPPLFLVPEDFGRVVLNLLDNACYAAQEKSRRQSGTAEMPRVKVSTRRVGGEVEIRVRDNGHGFPTELRDKIFMPFFTTKPAGEGTGLGLSLSHDIIVGSLGGRLSVECEQGLYTEFTIALPGALARSTEG